MTTTARQPPSHMRRQALTHWLFLVNHPYLLLKFILLLDSWSSSLFTRPWSWSFSGVFLDIWRHCQPLLLSQTGRLQPLSPATVLQLIMLLLLTLSLSQVFPEPHLSLSWFSEPDLSFPSYVDTERIEDITTTTVRRGMLYDVTVSSSSYSWCVFCLFSTYSSWLSRLPSAYHPPVFLVPHTWY